MNYIRHYIWFMKTSYSFMAPESKIMITIKGIRKGHSFAKDMCRWDKATPEQRKMWYASGEGRMIEF